MKTKAILLIWILLLILPMLSAASLKTDYPICQSTREIYTNCSMITPTLNCPTLTYQIINITGGVQVDSTLAEFNGSVYYFNLTVPQGDYIIRLCDNSTREVRVLEETDTMIPAILIIIPLIIGIIMIIASLGLGEEHVILKWFLFLGSIISTFISLQWASMAVIKFYNWEPMVSSIGNTTVTLIVLFIVIIAYLIIYTIYKGFRMAAQEKKEKLEY